MVLVVTHWPYNGQFVTKQLYVCAAVLTFVHNLYVTLIVCNLTERLGKVTGDHVTSEKWFSPSALTHLFDGPLSRTTRVMSRYQKGKTNLDFPETRDSEWQWHQVGHT